MGRKYIVPYGLYRAEGYISANLARKVTGFSEDDLELLWQAILNMFENDRSAARGKMAVNPLFLYLTPDPFSLWPLFPLPVHLNIQTPSHRCGLKEYCL